MALNFYDVIIELSFRASVSKSRCLSKEWCILIFTIPRLYLLDHFYTRAKSFGFMIVNLELCSTFLSASQPKGGAELYRLGDPLFLYLTVFKRLPMLIHIT